ncbi:MAG: glycosyltransferase family 4 protein [Pseudomonadales bacterium]|nr:glycosyltransferase family 4 protein [Pseudomonadales bacterium]
MDRQAPLKIALLGYRSNPYSGGQGIYLHYLSKALLAAGHEVDVISGPPYPELVDGVRLIELPSLDLFAAPNHVTALRWRHLRSLTDTFEYFSMLTGGFPEPYTFGRRLESWFRREKPRYDIVHDNQSLCYGTLALQNRGIPVVTTIHHPITSDLALALAGAESLGHRLLIKRWHNFIGMQKKVASRLHHIVTVSECSRRDIIEAFGLLPARVRVVYNGIDTETFRPLANVQRKPNQVMATASADQPLKGLAYLLRAMAMLRSHHPGLELLVVGKVKEGGETDRLLDSLGIRDRVRFVSGLRTEEIVRHYAESTVVVVPSIYEGFGFPAGEAMSCGVPVVSTDGGALPEVVGDAGKTVPVRDAGAIADAIGGLMADAGERERLGAAGRRRILERFSWQIAADQMVETYRSVHHESVET